MPDLWAGLPPVAQDVAVAALLALPGLLVGFAVLRGFAPWRLVRAMLWRFRWANLVFVLLIAVSVAVGVGLTAQERGLRQGSARAAERFDLVLGAPGSELTLTLAAVFLQPTDVPLLTGAQYAEVAADPDVALATPIAFGDSFEGAPVIGTTAPFVEHLAGRLAEGRLFATPSEAVAGAFAPVGPGDRFSPAHGQGEGAGEHAHHGSDYAVVGRMRPTGSPWDRAILVPVEGVWRVHGLADGHAPEAHDDQDHAHDDESTRIGPPFDPAHFPGTPAILVRADEVWANYALRSRYTRADMMAVFPGTVLAQLHGLLRDVREAMSLLAVVTQGLVAVAVLAGLVLLARLLARSLALLRAIGAPRRFVLAVVWSYSAALILTGAALGLLLGWFAAAALSRIITQRTEVLVTAGLGWGEIQQVCVFASLALALALVPAALAGLRSPLRDLRS
ncbi:FtsX-like permease family protein [Rubellimicrobium arenae]|uniref:FtsX-like permease family protein n=1 Tax=Rubellimicrobium arenae TaxID=2817372 RepID=UPI001B305D1A|nr:FtsX-like permease family protein [Rubellimicrobium arenae]